MYTTKNFKTKKALRDAIKAGEKIGVYNPGPFGSPPRDGSVTLEGPHYPAAHSWYAQAVLKDGYITSVR